MAHRLRTLAAVVAVAGLLAGGSVLAQPKDKTQDPHGQKGSASGKAKEHKDVSGKKLIGDRIKTNGSHKLEDHGKFASFVDVSNGKITGVNVKKDGTADVAVTKYKTTKNMAGTQASGFQLASYMLAQSQYIGTLWIGYGFIDDWGVEVIYWFPYDMILDGDTGAIDYYPSYY